MSVYDEIRDRVAVAQAEHDSAVNTAAALNAALAMAYTDLDAARATIEEQAATIAALEARIAELEAIINPPDPVDPALAAFGVCTPWQITADYGDVEAAFARVVELGVPAIRGRWRENGDGDTVMGLCAEHGKQWLVTLIPETWAETSGPPLATSSAMLEERLRALLAHPAAGEVVIGLENANEPNHGRSGATIATDWPARCAAWADIMYRVRDELGFTFPILSPAMHDTADDKAGGAHWQQLADSGCSFDVGSMHAYPKGKEATNLLDERLARFNAAFPERPMVWLTEFGWMTDPTRSGPVYTSPEQAAAYIVEAPELLYGYGGQIARAFYYELIGDDRGLWRDGSWTLPGLALADLYA